MKMVPGVISEGVLIAKFSAGECVIVCFYPTI